MNEPNENYQHLQHLQHLTLTTNRSETSVNFQDPAHDSRDSESSELKQAKNKPQRSWCPQTVGFKQQLKIYLSTPLEVFPLFCPIQEFSFLICTVKPSWRNKKQREELLHLYPGIALEFEITGCSNLFWWTRKRFLQRLAFPISAFCSGCPQPWSHPIDICTIFCAARRSQWQPLFLCKLYRQSLQEMQCECYPSMTHLPQRKRQRATLVGEEGVPTVGQRTDGKQPIDKACRACSCQTTCP